MALPDGLRFLHLQADDWNILKTIRMEALLNAHGLFGGSIESARHKTEADWRHMLEPVVVRYYTIMDGDTAVALMALFPNQSDPQNEVFLGAVYVNDAYRGKKLAHALFEHSIHEARQHGFSTMWCSTREGNTPIITLCMHFGFDHDRIESREWPDGITAPQHYFKLAL